MSSDASLESRIRDAIAQPKNLGEMTDADASGTVGSADCGDMLRMWVKFRQDEKGRKVIDRATFQTFGCETALAVASVATELIAGKTVDEALTMSGSDLSAPLGPLPPMKIHCAQLVEKALQSALGGGAKAPAAAPAPASTLAPAPAKGPGGAPANLVESFAGQAERTVKVVLKPAAPPAPAAPTE